MRTVISCLTLILAFVACKESEQKSIKKQAQNQQQNFVPKMGARFFEYDGIDYYTSDYDEFSILKLNENKDKSKTDQLKFDVVIGNFPKDITQTNFLKSMDKIGYKKKIISQDKFSEIDQLFVEKTVAESGTYACIAIYRDILVFKKQEKIVGIAKICFACHQHKIIGTNKETDNFGQNGDYKKLAILLNQ